MFPIYLFAAGLALATVFLVTSIFIKIFVLFIVALALLIAVSMDKDLHGQ
jgi:hypothetical protein